MSFTKNIILFGGTFDPVHIGHLILAQSAFEFICAQKVIFIPCYKPPHKIGFELSNWQHRVNMLKLSIKGIKHFELSLFEIRQKRISYTYITVDFFSQKFRDYNLYFLIGFDSLLSLPTWERWQQILQKVYFLVGERNVDKASMEKLPDIIIKKVVFFKSPIIEVSSSMIRERIKNKLSIKYFVSPSVEKYIINKKLYL
ncbi:MAG: nicotinate (nicotinamide) nucleotide adenylyltransferase [Endomicrobiia bacterium]